ncbi:MAG: 16S rRNA (cytosine(967)-C(5))-methyltransferase RsmB [Deltaproteobacteria bacterium]|nr:16S rRNA (cytosine(967)-C(5))-methyltransferase RsmB [Deltaproteobacteria bacterium]
MSSIKTRVRALDILNKAEKPGAHSSALLQRASQEKDVNLGLLQRLVKGTLQWRTRLDEAIDELLGNKKDKLPLAVRNLLRMAAYQILFLKKVPMGLLCKETLELAKPHANVIGQRELESLLGRLEQAPKRKDSQRVSSTSAAGMAREFSHPQWVIERWIEELGVEESAKLCQANNRPWPTTVRANTLRISAHQLEKKFWQEHVKVEACRYSPGCYRILELPRHTRLHELESFQRGLFQVQDESSALVGLLVDARPGEFVLDMCAAPGGKATHLATLMKNRGKLLAIDNNAKKLSYIQENSRRQGLRIIQAKQADAAKLTLRTPADRVLLDAPCSGLGVIGRKADLRWAKDAAEIVQLVALQTKLLNNAATLVRPGGVLVYSTCTVERAENEGVVENFLASHKNFKVAAPSPELDKALFTKEGFLRTWPHRHRMAGAFAAVMERVS